MDMRFLNISPLVCSYCVILMERCMQRVSFSQFELQLPASPTTILFSFLFPFFPSLRVVVCFSSGPLVFGNICLQRKLHKHTTWVRLVIWGHIANYSKFYDLYLCPCYESFYVPSLTVKSIKLILGLAHIWRIMVSFLYLELDVWVEWGRRRLKEAFSHVEKVCSPSYGL